MWIVDGLTNGLRMFWEVWWALVLGFALSGIVQAWVPRARLEHALGGRGLREVSLATAFGAASSSCSYAAIAIAKSLFAKGASLASAITFQFASTNLVFELGLVIWIFLGWQFTLAEFVGGFVLILLTWVALARFVSRRQEEDARAHAVAVDSGHVHHTAQSTAPSLGRKLTSLQAWSDVAQNFRADWTMLWKEILAGFVIAGYVSTLPATFFNRLFLTDAWAPLRIVENAIVGPLVAALAFVCSIGNIPLAAVLWSGGISFSGVLAFIYADLIIIPIVLAYRKYYGGRFAAPDRRDHVRSDGPRGARRGWALLAARPGADEPTVARLDLAAADHVELHGGSQPDLPRRVRRADRAHHARGINTHCHSTFEANPEEVT